MKTKEYKTRAEWLAARRQGLGGSDAPAVLGVDPFRDAVDIYLSKLSTDEPDEQKEYQAWGHKLEPLRAEEYAERTERTVTDPGEYTIFQADGCDFQMATIDRLVEDPKRGMGVLQIKTTNAFNKKAWMEGAPEHVLAQIQHEMSVVGAEWGSIAVLIGGQTFYHMDLDANKRFQDYLFAQELEFWDNLKAGRPPEVSLKTTAKALQALYGSENEGDIVDLPDDLKAKAEEFEQIKAQLKELNTRKGLLANQIKAAIGEAEFGLFEDGSGYRWFTVPGGKEVSYVTKDQRRLIQVKPKESK